MYNSYKNPLSSAASYLNKIYKGVTGQNTQQPAAIPGINTNPVTAMSSPYQYKPYQMKTGDTFEKVAQANSMSVADIQAANNGMLVPPPKGSYINLPNGQQMAGPASMMIGPVQQTRPNTNDTLLYGNHINWKTVDPVKDAAALQAQITQGIAPDRVPVSLLGALGATPQSMLDNGYVFDPSSRTYVLSVPETQAQMTGAAGQVSAGIGTGSAEFMNTGFMQNYAAKGTEFTNQLRWDPKRKKYVKIGKLIKEGKLDVRTGRFYPNGRNAKHGGPKGGYNRGSGGGGQQEVAPPPEPVYGAGGTPSTVLSLHLGGG